MELERQLLGKLCVVSSHALRHGMAAEALTICDGIKEVMPGNPDVVFSWSLAKISTMHPEEAIAALLEHVLPKRPEDPEARCYLGLAYKIAGRHCEGDEILYGYMNSSDEKSRNLANKLIDYADTMV